MIIRDELKRVFRLLKKHEDLLINSYLDNNSMVEELIDDLSSIDSLIDARILWRPSGNESVRLSRELSSLFERLLRDPRRLSIDADIGQFLKNIQNNINHYKESAKNGNTHDSSHYLGQIERLIDDLRSSLLDSSGALWQKINSEFGYVTSLDLKIKENQFVLDEAKCLIDRIEMIKVSEMDEWAGSDPLLQHYLQRWLLDSVEICRLETRDAMDKLNDLLFEYRKQQRLGKMIDTLYRQYQNQPGYIPSDYAGMGDIPSVFNQVPAMTLTGHVDISDPQQEIILTEIISGLRKERVELEEPETLERIEVKDDEPAVDLEYSPLRQAVEDFYLAVVDSDQPLRAVDYIPSDHVESDSELWIYAVIARHNNMDEQERSLFNISFVEEPDPIFNGRHIVCDVIINLNPSNSIAA